MSICGAQVCVISRVLASYSKTEHPTIISSSTVEHRFGRKGFKVPMIGAINPLYTKLKIPVNVGKACDVIGEVVVFCVACIFISSEALLRDDGYLRIIVVSGTCSSLSRLSRMTVAMMPRTPPPSMLSTHCFFPGSPLGRQSHKFGNSIDGIPSLSSLLSPLC